VTSSFLKVDRFQKAGSLRVFTDVRQPIKHKAFSVLPGGRWKRLKKSRMKSLTCRETGIVVELYTDFIRLGMSAIFIGSGAHNDIFSFKIMLLRT